MNVYERLGVKKRINAAANGTSIGGSIMLPEVVAAMQEAGRSHVSIPELLEQAGNRIAQLAGVDACTITNGAAAGVAVSVAACMTGSSNARVHQLPDTAGMKDEVIVQRMQINFYELMIRLTGARIVPAGLANRTYPWHLEAAFTPQTAAVVHFPAYSPPTDLPIDRVVELAHARGVPVIVDAAAEFPPFSILSHYWKLGADLTIVSGGKGLRGPQSSGLILGRKSLVEACVMSGSPNHGVGRPMKVGKEEIAGLLTAVELWSEPRVRGEDVRLLAASRRFHDRDPRPGAGCPGADGRFAFRVDGTGRASRRTAVHAGGMGLRRNRQGRGTGDGGVVGRRPEHHRGGDAVRHSTQPRDTGAG